MVRNAGKFGKPKRGGGKQFTRNLQRLDNENAGIEEGSGAGSSGTEDSDASKASDEKDTGENAPKDEARINNPNYGSTLTSPSTSRAQTQGASTSMSIAEARAARKATKKGGNPTKNDDSEDESDASLEDLAKPNRSQNKTVKITDIDKVASGPMNRKERELAEKKAAQERYWKLHQAGKTDEAKVDLARLAKIRQEREHAAAVRKAETQAKEKEAADKLAARKKR